ncbi:MAG: hypothetical protein KDN22_14250, partial [Verrucomicrobiae bacterium]|nr:hypothetical protein [Verrucomicrobiae bacterium]
MRSEISSLSKSDSNGSTSTIARTALRIAFCELKSRQTGARFFILFPNVKHEARLTGSARSMQ